MFSSCLFCSTCFYNVLLVLNSSDLGPKVHSVMCCCRAEFLIAGSGLSQQATPAELVRFPNPLDIGSQAGTLSSGTRDIFTNCHLLVLHADICDIMSFSM